MSLIRLFSHFAVFGVLSGSLARSWRQMWLAVVGVNVFYATLSINELVHYKLKDYRYPLLTLWQALEWVMTERDTYLLLGVQLSLTAGFAIVIFWLRQVLAKVMQ